MWLISKKVTIEDSGLLSGFRDCHCHLLPGVDDGVQETAEALDILKLWEQAGVKEVWLTPHVMEDIPNKTTELKERFETLKAQYSGGVGLHLAAENMLDSLFIPRLDSRDLLTIGKDKKHLLVETSYYNPPMDMGRLMERVREEGYIPVLAHPERYQYMDMEDFKTWKKREVRLQLNAPSLVGAYGPDVQYKAERLLDREMYDYCGTDTHSIQSVEYFLSRRISRKTVNKLWQIVAHEDL